MITASLMEEADGGGVTWETLDNLKDSYVKIKKTEILAYVWGGIPRHHLGMPDMLFITLMSNEKDYEISADRVEIADKPTRKAG